MRTYHTLVFVEHLIIFTERDEEDERSDILEAMDPLLSLRPLPSNVEHAVSKILNDERCLCYTGSLDTRSEDVLIVRYIVVGCDAIYGVEVAKRKKDVSRWVSWKDFRADV